MTLTSLCRATRPLISPMVQTGAPARTMGSLSGIHRGIRRSDKNTRRPDGGKPMTYRERQEARANVAPPPFRMFRGKKDVTDYPDKAPKAQTRRARFFDPESNFGKKSLVYKVKTGKIADELGFDALGDALKPAQSRSSGGDVFSDKIRGFGSDNQDFGAARGRGGRGRSGLSSPRQQPNDFGDATESKPPRSSSFSAADGRGRDFGKSRDSGERSRSVRNSRGGPRDFGAREKGAPLAVSEGREKTDRLAVSEAQGKTDRQAVSEGQEKTAPQAAPKGQGRIAPQIASEAQEKTAQTVSAGKEKTALQAASEGQGKIAPQVSSEGQEKTAQAVSEGKGKIARQAATTTRRYQPPPPRKDPCHQRPSA